MNLLIYSSPVTPIETHKWRLSTYIHRIRKRKKKTEQKVTSEIYFWEYKTSAKIGPVY